MGVVNVGAGQLILLRVIGGSPRCGASPGYLPNEVVKHPGDFGLLTALALDSPVPTLAGRSVYTDLNDRLCARRDNPCLTHEDRLRGAYRILQDTDQDPGEQRTDACGNVPVGEPLFPVFLTQIKGPLESCGVSLRRVFVRKRPACKKSKHFLVSE